MKKLFVIIPIILLASCWSGSQDTIETNNNQQNSTKSDIVLNDGAVFEADIITDDTQLSVQSSDNENTSSLNSLDI